MLKLSFRSSASLLGSSSVLFYLMVKSAEQGELMPQRQACVLVLLGTDQNPLCLPGIKRDISVTGKQSQQVEMHREHLILTENNGMGSGHLCCIHADLAFTQ